MVKSGRLENSLDVMTQYEILGFCGLGLNSHLIERWFKELNPRNTERDFATDPIYIKELKRLKGLRCPASGTPWCIH